MWSILSKALVILTLVLLIPTTLVFASQNAVPGDMTYSLKRSMENMISTLASVNPSTKVMFKNDLSKKRFQESIVLLNRGDKKSTQSLVELVSQTKAAADALDQIQNPVFKKQYSQNLAKQIDEYKIALQKQELNKSVVAVIPVITPTTTSSLKPSLIPTLLPSTTRLSNTPTLTPPTPTPFIAPTPKPTPDPIEDAVDDLDKIQKRLGNIQNKAEKQEINSNKEDKKEGDKNEEKQDNNSKKNTENHDNKE